MNILKLTQELLPNAVIKEMFGCYSVTDNTGEVIGYVDGQFYLNENYRYARVIYERFLNQNIEVKTYERLHDPT